MKTIKKMLSLVLVLALVLGIALPVSATDTEAVSFTKIGNDAVNTDLSDRAAKSEEEAPEYSSSDIVRVSIVLEGNSTIEAGYSTSGIAENAGAMAYRESLLEKQEAIAVEIGSKALNGKTLDVVWNMTLVANIISANVAYGRIDEIKEVEGVKSVFVETQYAPDVVSTGAADPNMATSSEMIGSTSAYLEGYTGAGSRIAIIDTGTDTDHQSFSAAGFEYSLRQNAEEKGMSYEAYVESLDLLDIAELTAKFDQLHIKKLVSAPADLYLNTKLPFGFNYVDEDLDIIHDNDSEGEHGSHVAGIATANKYIPNGESFVKALESVKTQGVAPDAQLITMKVFGKGGGAYDSDYMVAIEDAIILGCDSVNLSLGSGNPGASNAGVYQKVMDSLAETDTVVVMSAGNSGAWMDNSANGVPYLYADDVSMQTDGSPGSFTNSLAVASVDNIGYTGSVIGVGDVLAPYSETTGYTNRPIATLDTSEDGSGIEYDYVFFTNTGAAADGSNLLLDYADVIEGKVVYVYRGSSSFYQKHMAVEEAGGIACIVNNNQPGVINMDLSDSTATIPCVSILQTDAAAIMEASTPFYAEDGKTVLYYTGKVSISGTISSSILTDEYVMSDFSSWGVPGSLELKPEITAPGGNIYSVNGAIAGGTSYEVMSGTSMAAPQVAGMAALVKQYIEENNLDEKISGITIRALAQSLLMSTAEPLIESDSGSYYSVMKQGAGLANVGSAVKADSYVLVDGQDDGKVKIELGDDPARTGEYTAKFTLNNLTEEALAYNLEADFFTQDVFPHEGNLYLDTWTAMMQATATWTANGKVIESASAILPYDFDGDGDSDKDDAQALLDLLTGVREDIENAEYADVNEDETVTTADVSALLKLLSSATVTVPASGSVEITVTFALTAAQKNFLDTYYTNGAYVEGFLYAIPATTAEGELGVTHSIPVLGFYGNWSDPSMYDVGSLAEFWYGLEDRDPYLPDSSGYPEMFTNYMTIKYAGNDSEYYYFGNPLLDDDEYLPERNGFNNVSGDVLYRYYIAVIRNAGNAKFVVKNAETGEVYMEQELGAVSSAYYYSNGGAWRSTMYNLNLGWKGTDSEGNKLPEGTTVEISLVLAPEYYDNGDGTYDWDALGEGAYQTTMTTIDNTAPEITGIYRSVSDKKLVITAQDNEYIAAIAVYDKTGSNDLAYASPNQTVAGEEQSVTLDLSDIEDEELIVTVYDYAMNVSTYKILFTEPDASETTATSISVAPETATIYKGSTVQLTAITEPWIVNDTPTWSSSDETIATVNARGAVTGVGKGECTITATSSTNPELTAACTVTVKTVAYTVNGVLQDESAASMSFTWDLENDPTWTKIADIGPSIGAAAQSGSDTVYIMDATDATVMHEVDPLTGETLVTGASAAIPYWDMATSKIFTDENDGDLIYGIYAGYLFVQQDPMAPTAYGYNLGGSLKKFTGATWLIGVESAGLYYDEEDGCFAELIWAMDDAGYVWIFEYTENGDLYLFNFYDTGLSLDLPGSGDYLQCSLVEADDYKLFFSYFDGNTNVFYMLDEVIGENGFIASYVPQIVGDVGQDVWPAPITSVTFNEPATETDAAPVAPAAFAGTEIEKTEFDISNLVSFNKTAAKGGLNAITVETQKPEKPEDPSTATVTITADEAMNNGLYEISYNVDEMELVSFASNAELSSFNNEDGKLTFGFASETAVAAETTLATLTFQNKAAKCASEITVATPETEAAPEIVSVAFAHSLTATEAKAADCTEDGNIAYWYCSICEKYFSDEACTTEITLADTVLAAIGHTIVIDAPVAATCTEAGLSAGSHCSVCGTILIQPQPVAANGHAWGQGLVTTPAACTEAGEMTFTCANCEETKTETIAATGHTIVIDAAVTPTCTSTGLTTGSHCSVCDTVFIAQETVAALEHAWDEGTVTTPATCTEAGVMTYACADCAATKTEEIPAAGHSLTATAAKAATCAEDGNTAYWYCATCEKYFSDEACTTEIAQADTILAATEHAWDAGVVTTEPTCKTAGVMTFTCANCDATRTEVIPMTECTAKVFTDCTKDWYHDAIDFMVGEGYMEGLNSSYFNPDGTMTRAMMVTVLYRIAGEPEVTAPSTFKDVEDGRWYSDAIAWAQQNEIILGVTVETFEPNTAVTREQIATILYRFAESPKVEADFSDFVDADEISKYAVSAMAWAVEEGIFQGNEKKELNAKDDATRAEFAVMMSRYLK